MITTKLIAMEMFHIWLGLQKMGLAIMTIIKFILPHFTIQLQQYRQWVMETSLEQICTRDLFAFSTNF